MDHRLSDVEFLVVVLGSVIIQGMPESEYNMLVEAIVILILMGEIAFL